MDVAAHISRMHDIFLTPDYVNERARHIQPPLVVLVDRAAPAVASYVRGVYHHGRWIYERRNTITVDPSKVKAAINLVGRPSIRDIVIVEAEVVEYRWPQVIKVTGIRMPRVSPVIETCFIVIWEDVAVVGKTPKGARNLAWAYKRATPVEWKIAKLSLSHLRDLLITDVVPGAKPHRGSVKIFGIPLSSLSDPTRDEYGRAIVKHAVTERVALAEDEMWIRVDPFRGVDQTVADYNDNLKKMKLEADRLAGEAEEREWSNMSEEDRVDMNALAGCASR